MSALLPTDVDVLPRAMCRAQVMLTVELQRRLRPGGGVMCFVLHPGEVTTGITRTLPGPVHRLYRAVIPRFLLLPDQGVLTLHEL